MGPFGGRPCGPIDAARRAGWNAHSFGSERFRLRGTDETAEKLGVNFWRKEAHERIDIA
jgi:hypothetical protein